MSRNLIIDGQVLQTNAWYRGMGKYTLQIMQELSKNISSDTRLFIVFNDKLKTDTMRYETVKFLCPNIKQLHFNLPVSKEKKAKPENFKKALELKINKEFKNQDNYYLITSLFTFEFFAQFPNNCKKLLLFYDLTPLLFWCDLGGYFPPDLYMSRFEQIVEADRVLCISATTREDILNVFGLPPKKVVNINGGFTKIANSSEKPTGFKVPEKFILFPTGDLPHKNNDVAISGFEAYSQKNDRDTPLLVTSSFSKESEMHLLTLSENVIFTGNVTDEELEWLYENAAAILFASKYEGLGMPILDAVAAKKAIITSRIPVFEEMSKDAFYYFDPSNETQLASVLSQAIQLKDFDTKSKLYPSIIDKYSWSNTVKDIVETIDSLDDGPEEDKSSSASSKPRIAIVCVHPGVKDQIGRLAESLYYSLSVDFSIDYYFDSLNYHPKDIERPTFLDFFDCKCFDITKLTIQPYKKYDAIVYLVDKEALPSRLAQRACIFPGVMVTDFTKSNLDKQKQMLKELMLDNQYSTYDFENNSYKSYEEINKNILLAIEKNHQNPTPAEVILKAGGFNSSIIRKLLALRSN